MPGQLQKMFGGSNANAYMLVYRQRILNQQATEVPKIPDYWKSIIDCLNMSDKSQRVNYETLRNQFDIIMLDSRINFEVTDDTNFVTLR